MNLTANEYEYSHRMPVGVSSAVSRMPFSLVPTSACAVSCCYTEAFEANFQDFVHVTYNAIIYI